MKVIFPDAWMTNKIGAGRIHHNIGTSLYVALALWFLNEQEVRVSPARRSQLATAAVCTEQHQMEVASCSQSYRTQLIVVEYDDEGLQRAPELERRQTAVDLRGM